MGDDRTFDEAIADIAAASAAIEAAKMQFAAAVRTARRAKGISQYDLGNRLFHNVIGWEDRKYGLDPNQKQVALWEHGVKVPSAREVRELIHALDTWPVPETAEP